jgi:hypothetical protein
MKRESSDNMEESNDELKSEWRKLIGEYPNSIRTAISEGLITANQVQSNNKKSDVKKAIVREIEKNVKPEGVIDERVIDELINWGSDT